MTIHDSLTIKENEIVAEELRKTEDSNRRRQKYYKWANGQRAEIGKRAAWHGNAPTVRLFGGKYPGLKGQTVSDFKLAYLELKKKKGNADDDREEKNGSPNITSCRAYAESCRPCFCFTFKTSSSLVICNLFYSKGCKSS